MDGPEPSPQMKHGIVLAREQRIYAEAGLGRQVFETASVQLVCDKDLALLLGKLVQRGIEFFHQEEPR
jgi:hypothetical protein